MGHRPSVDFEPAIWARLIQAQKVPISPEAAHYLLSINFSETDHARMQELMDKSNEGALTSDETAGLDGYVNISNVLSVVHSRARVAIGRPGVEPLRDARDT